ncbi:MAG: hypothetical protein VKK04_14720 [Synechococcales bacterium]|nr:hypothetical protein [Synechococcales bacterium]
MSDHQCENSLDAFLVYCRSTQPQEPKDIQRFFEGVICFPYDKELLLQAYLFFNIQEVFPFCTELLLFEKPPYGEYTNVGKCDFVYGTRTNTVLLIETKYIDTDASGDTERKRRNKHRNKVFQQVLTLRETFQDYWGLTADQVACAVFTTDTKLDKRGENRNVITHAISTQDLARWQQQQRDSLWN